MKPKFISGGGAAFCQKKVHACKRPPHLNFGVNGGFVFWVLFLLEKLKYEEKNSEMKPISAK